MVENKVKGATKKVRKAFRSLEAYKGGQGEILSVLHHLDVTDKHRLLLTTTRQKNVVVTTTDSIRLTSTVAGMSEPAEETPVPPTTSKPNPHFEYTFDVLFDEPGVVEFEPVRPFLRTLVEATNDVIRDFSKFL